MFKKRKQHKYLNSYVKAPTSIKVNSVINQAIPQNSGLSDEAGLIKAYS